ncbi:hypothetical protein, partial [Bartonella vinsonii]|uniref:hypothetical protein n=1 Tax=Bartonella vinsonii TaxID=33047 RepID=UPI001ABA5F61
MQFLGLSETELDESKYQSTKINLTNAKLHVKNGIGISVNEAARTVNLGKKSEIRADVLLITK